MIILIYIFGVLCGFVLSTACYAFLIDPQPRTRLHPLEPETTPLPALQETEAMRLPTGMLWKDWNSRHSFAQTQVAKEDESWLL